MSQEKPEKEEWWIKEMRDIEEQKWGGGWNSREARGGGRDNELSNWVVIQWVEGLLGKEETTFCPQTP